MACTCMWVHASLDARGMIAQVILELLLVVCVDMVVAILQEDV